MKKQALKALLKKRETIVRRITGCSDFMRGTITSVCSTCNRAKCICTAHSAHRAYRLTYKEPGQKSRTVYIPATHLARARKMIRNYSTLRKLNEQLLELNIEIFKIQSKS